MTTHGLEWQRFQHRLRLLKKWWLRPHTPFQPLFVVATCRSGSNLLLSHLRQQPGVSMYSEVLCHVLPIGPSARQRIPPAQALSHIRYSLQAEKTPIRGCKLMLYQLEDCGLTMNDLDAAFPGAKYIILYRESLAEQFVSHQLADATQQYLLLPGQERAEARLTVDPAALRAYCDDVRQGYRKVLSHPRLAERSVLLSYEALAANPQHWLRDRIGPLLGIDASETQTHLRKQSTRPLCERIENYREVADLLESDFCRQAHAWPGGTAGERHAA